MSRVLAFLFQRSMPRWVIFFIDMGICLFSLLLAYLVRFNFNIPSVEIEAIPLVLSIILGVRACSFLISRTYQGIVKFTGSEDAKRIFIVVSLGSISYVFINFISYQFINKIFLIPFSIIIIDYMATAFLMISLRIMFKALYMELTTKGREKRNVVIVGAGDSSIITKRALEQDITTKYNIIAFVDEGIKKQYKKIEGTTIITIDQLDELASKKEISTLIIASTTISPQRKQKVVDICLNYEIPVLTVPPVAKWINGELSLKQIKIIQIEELLERDPIQLNKENIKTEVTNKIILVTGAAGSIGSEIVRQVIRFSPKRIILLDQAESPLYDMEMELYDKYKQQAYAIVIGDIRNKERIENVFRTFKPNLVFHAAAYKHVPMMENNPSESILTNVYGTKVLADLAVKYAVEKFVMISTDKAVNPTNVMGASKRLAEIYIQALSKVANTKFITTRFGNVLGSSGSVIPRFKQQLENGGPITITHPEITRYFMTIPEACQLVLEAGAMGNGGEIFIFNMGESVKIVDLAKKMIKLSGLLLDKDIKIVYTGLRPGEKLYEELLADYENTLPTHHQQIMVAKVKEYDFEKIASEIGVLIKMFETQNNKAIVSKMKELVPEFRSNNSVFEELDIKE